MRPMLAVLGISLLRHFFLLESSSTKSPFLLLLEYIYILMILLLVSQCRFVGHFVLYVIWAKAQTDTYLPNTRERVQTQTSLSDPSPSPPPIEDISSFPLELHLNFTVILPLVEQKEWVSLNCDF